MTAPRIVLRTSGSVPEPRGVLLSARAAVLVLCVGLTAAQEAGWDPALRIIALSLVAALASLPLTSIRLLRARPVLEAAAASAVAMAAGGPYESLLPYLLIPALEAGLAFGVSWAVVTVGTAAAVMLVSRVFDLTERGLRDYSVTAAQWLLLALAVGLLAAWIRRLTSETKSESNEAYLAAYRLISQLRTVSRQLRGGLDSVSIAEQLLQGLRQRQPFSVGVVYIRTPGGRLLPLAQEGWDTDDWDASLESDSALSRAWTSQAPVVQKTSIAGDPGMASIVLPLKIGSRGTGLVALDIEASDVSALNGLQHLVPLVDESALRLETALLFGEVRSIATAEERRRLAREIHDGIAQELAFLGYVVDELRAKASKASSELEEPLQDLRREVTRIIGELRMSIFDLRSEVEPHSGLGAALSDYVSGIGPSSGLTVRLELDESPRRLGTEVEEQLFRIAQEAITNVRKHADADNLWVILRTDPPQALLRVEDDGRGLGAGGSNRFGIQTMHERAAWIGGSIRIGERTGGGTYVEVAVGTL